MHISCERTISPDSPRVLAPRLLGLAVRNMLTAATAELLELETLRGLLFVLRRYVVAFFTLSTLQYNVVAHDV